MSKQRNEILPGAGVWDSFFDKEVQRLLLEARNIPALNLDLPEPVKLEFLAWPIIAYCAVDDLVNDLPSKAHRQVQFLDAYGQDPMFIANLLSSLTNYRYAPEAEKTLTRRVIDLSNQCSDDGLISLIKPARSRRDKLNLHDWKTLADISGCQNSHLQLKTEFNREKKRRQGIEKEWRGNFEAWRQLEALRPKAAYLLPLQNVSVRHE